MTWTDKQKQRQKAIRRLERKNETRRISFRTLLIAVLLAAFVAPPLGYFGFDAYQNYFNSVGDEPQPAASAAGTIVVRAGENFQAALDRAKPGETILLEAGATFRGNFNLPRKTGNEFVTVRSSASDAQLPPAGVRLDPQRYAAVLPKLASPNNEPTLAAFNGAHHFRFVGVEFQGTKDGVGNIVKIGSGEENRVEDLPHHIEFDRVFIRSVSPQGQRRGIAANGRHLKITNSHIADIKRKGDESQAIAAWATDGPIEITNNYLEAAAENILFGGAVSVLGLIPTNCVVKNNWLNKPLSWRAEDWPVKNLFEIKNGRRIRIENNLMTNNWGSAQDGTAVVIKSTSDSGEGAVAEDIEFIGNVVRGAGNALGINGSEAKGGRRLTVRHNVFDDISGAKWNGSGFFMKSSDWDGLVIENNTIIQTGNIASAYGEPVSGLIFRNNIVFENEYGFKGDGTPSGVQTINRFFPGGDVSFNAIVGGIVARYRADSQNIYPSALRQLGLISPKEGNLALRPDSPLRGKGYQGANIGADLSVLTMGSK